MKNPPHEACVLTGNGRQPVKAAPDGMSGLGHMIPAVIGFLSHRDVFWPLRRSMSVFICCLPAFLFEVYILRKT